jgi:hypothetical protein
MGLLNYRSLPNAGRWFTWLMAVWLIIEIIAFMLRIKGTNNWIVYMMLSFFEILLMTMFYQSIFQNHTVKTICTALAWIGLFVIVGEYSMIQSAENTIGVLYECSFFVAMGLYALYEMNVMKHDQRFKFLNSVMIFFFVASGLYAASWKFMERDTFIMAITLHAYMLIIFYGLFTYSIWKLRD